MIHGPGSYSSVKTGKIGWINQNFKKENLSLNNNILIINRK